MTITVTVVLLLVLLVARAEKKTGLRWEIEEQDGRLVRALTDGSQVVTLDYNQKGQLIQCWATREGKTPTAISFLYYAVRS